MVLIFVALIVVTLVMRGPAERLKREVLAAAQKKIGREVGVGGFGGNPFTGFSIRDIRVGGVDGGSDSITAERLKFRVSFGDLLKGRLSVSGIELVAPRVFIEKYPGGTHSLTDVVESMSSGPQEEKPEKGASRIEIGSIKVRRGELNIKIIREEGDPVELVVDDVSAVLKPEVEIGKYTVEAGASLDRIRINAEGRLQPGAENEMDLAFEMTPWLTFEDPPEVVEGIKELLGELHVRGRLAAGGRVTGSFSQPVVHAEIEIEEVDVLDNDLGGGKFLVDYAGQRVSFDGGIGSDYSKVQAKGGVTLGEEPSFEMSSSFSGLDPDAAMALLAPDMPPMVSGALSGTAKLTGSPASFGDAALAADVLISDGVIKYPTPSLYGHKDARAELPFKSFSAKVAHTAPELEISSFELLGDAMKAGGKGKIRYARDAMTGAATGPLWFDASAVFESGDVEKLMAHNSYLGNFVTGSFTGSANLSGRSDQMSRFAGGGQFTLLDGAVINPYAKDSGGIPLNATLSHFEFDSIEGSFDVAKQVLKAKKLSLRSVMIDADIAGDLGFDGIFGAHAEVSLMPQLIESVNDFKSAMPKLQAIKDLKRVDTAFDISGSLQNPQVSWDVEGLIASEAERLLQKETDKIMDKVKDRVKDSTGIDLDKSGVKQKLKDKIKGLF